jgi:hypothetical protein
MTTIATLAPSASASAIPKIAGKALYLELINNPDAGSIGYWYKNGVKQVIILPQHLDEVGISQPVQIWHRVVSEHSPRSQWDMEILGNGRLVKKPTQEQLDSATNYHFAYDSYTKEELDFMTDREKHEAGVFTLGERVKGLLLDTYHETDAEGNSLSRVQQTWLIRDSKPLAVEVLDNELEQARSHKTPQAIIRRIQKARVSAGFPEKMF